MPNGIGPNTPVSPVGGSGPSIQPNEATRPAGQSIQQNPGHQLSSAPKSNGSSRMSQLRASLPKLNTSEEGLKPKANGNESPASPNADVFKTALSSPTSSAPNSASPFSSGPTPPPQYQSGPQTPGTPMSAHDFKAVPPHGGQPPAMPPVDPGIPQNADGLIAHMQQTNYDNQKLQMAMNDIQNGQMLFNTAMTAGASQRKILMELAEAQAKTATAGATAVKNLS